MYNQYYFPFKVSNLVLNNLYTYLSKASFYFYILSMFNWLNKKTPIKVPFYK
ncbi:hypothetical protein GCWU000323_01433 [Leptotrichia hofstadii F0254]|uniref:Uncharacterized protein n=1 Tax=Leptotrichia hofstadii F0254 TaxID=634994 RepID=C9MY11_9FUSO|nr:hypothetical protein GCWU000323_01433 [Leptotrichia hofstadii F0254]